MRRRQLTIQRAVRQLRKNGYQVEAPGAWEHRRVEVSSRVLQQFLSCVAEESLEEREALTEALRDWVHGRGVSRKRA